MRSPGRRVGWLLVTCFLLTCATYAATISGKVRDDHGRSVSGAIVRIAGTTTKAITGTAGEFALAVPESAEKVRLLVEAPGFYATTGVFVPGQAFIEIVMTPRLRVTEEVAVIAPRLEIPAATLPAAMSVITGDATAEMPRGIAAEEALESAPGVKVDNQANGERVHLSIRGQGILSERGIRGIQVMLDAIPLNDPSGFASDLFDIDWAGVRDLEIVRGPVAFLYGGGSGGGVIAVRSREPEQDLHGQFWSTGGSNTFYKARGEVSGTAKGVAYLISAARSAGDGYRQHTAFWANNLFVKLSFNVARRLRLNVTGFGTGFWNQNAEGLNLAWLAHDRRMANPDAITFNEYQRTVRGTGAISGKWGVTERQRVSFTFYSRHTRYTEPVPSNVDHRSITAPGGSFQYDLDFAVGGIQHHFSAGTDLDGQYTDQTKYLNMGMAVEGSLVANQSIAQKRAALFFTDQLAFAKRWTVLASVRADWFGNRLDDHFGIATGERNFQHTTGRVGVSYRPRHEFGLYASWGQGFVPPATEELTTNPAAFGGFNLKLVPATSWGVDIGARGSVRGRLYYDASVFRLDTNHDFERYRCPQPGAVCYPLNRPLETFYANAGNTRRYGLETSLRWLPARRLALTAAYTYSHFRYTEYNSFVYAGALAGNSLPNSPAHQWFAEGTVELPRDFRIGLGTQAFSRAYIDPTNQTWIDGYGLLHARLSKGIQLGRTYATLSVNGRNLAATRYIAFTEPDPDGNSYQPGPDREVFGAVQFRF